MYRLLENFTEPSLSSFIPSLLKHIFPRAISPNFVRQSLLGLQMNCKAQAAMAIGMRSGMLFGENMGM
jgi:hypothetical protein